MPTDIVELRLAGAIGILTSGSSSPQTYQGDVVGDDVTYDFGTDIVSAVSTSLKIKF
jgi:long-chain fatty acid transport protein